MIKDITPKLIILVSSILLVICCLWFVYESPEEMLAKIRSVPSPFWGAKEAFSAIGLSEEEYEPCLIWAFGEEYNKVPMRNLADSWRQRHGALFIIHDADYAYDAFKRIGEAYENQGKCLDTKTPIE